ncbi:DUF501 domain-containing protein [Crossiella sp. SN42]|uniref:DUF501 domain-containing protein n=1 Tax=Crossiella sp. SN42 TaxID=2944808 RepID=UPI00207D6AFE|nr:DUF501 domain-containing protein [Crossiella sp. SN42]MCO1577118.1 DUF501 domain-containing protein [Crossiella sp. SN42]
MSEEKPRLGLDVPPVREELTEADRAAVTAQLGRSPRGVRAVAYRCPCGNPAVLQTNPRLDDGTPFPTMYYSTCPRVNSMLGTQEASGLMKEMTDRLEADQGLADQYLKAHESYLAERDSIEPLGTKVTAGGMPDRVKCLHVQVAHALACGRGVNPFGDESADRLGDWWRSGSCV